MRATVCALVAATCCALSANAQTLSPPAFWKGVQANCDATARRPASDLGRRIAQTAIDEFTRFDGHQIDSDGRIFRFGLTEAEHEEDDGGARRTTAGYLGWWQVMQYWRTLFGKDTPEYLEVLGYRDASTLTDATQVTALLRTSAARLLSVTEGVSDPETKEVLRETALRAAVVDTSWSAAFISHVMRRAGVAANAFRIANAHRVYIYDAFASSAAELSKQADDRIYRACPLTATRPRVGDMICTQREPSLVDMSDEAVRERIRAELDGDPSTRTIRRTHCEVVAHVDTRARKMYTVGGNVNQSVTARKLNLRGRGLKFSIERNRNCGKAHWTLPPAETDVWPAPSSPKPCSLNDKKWFVLLQLR